MSKRRTGVALAAALAAGVLSAAGCAPVRKVATVGQLHEAVRTARAGDDIVIAPGTYRLRGPLRINVPRVTLRGATGTRDDVVLVGGGMNRPRRPIEGVMIECDDITVRDLTLRDFYRCALHIRAETDTDRALISNVRTINIGERHVKGSRGRGGHVSEDVVIERLHMLQTQKRARRPGHPVNPDDYIGGIDAMSTRGWIIRDCLAQGIRGATGGGNAAIFIWNGVDNITIERNRIIDCCKGIALGNPSGPYRRRHHAVGGIIRNNFILRCADTDLNNIGLELCNVTGVKVYHNTIYSADAAYPRAVHLLDERGEGLTKDVELAYNIIRGRIRDNTVSGGWRPTGNLHGWRDQAGWHGPRVGPEWFVDAAAGDLHLTARAKAAIDAAGPLADVADDIDGAKRPVGQAPDVGADEHQPAGGGS